LVQAGRPGIRFTTGLLLGVGESFADRERALRLTASLHDRFGRIQEVILRPLRPSGDAPEALKASERDDVLSIVAMPRALLPPAVHLKLPANLWPVNHLVEAVETDINDLGGIDSRDVINPAYRQPNPSLLQEVLAQGGSPDWKCGSVFITHPAPGRDGCLSGSSAPLRQRQGC